jgi:cytochrome oxidase assembly protein ShyY1
MNVDTNSTPNSIITPNWLGPLLIVVIITITVLCIVGIWYLNRKDKVASNGVH